ncbi:hypothetical protein E2542_SST25896 [Spatholobus suberectus]|nr:hypothetical protein E2542_SST25896 [Spatholobus suberectus]
MRTPLQPPRHQNTHFRNSDAALRREPPSIVSLLTSAQSRIFASIISLHRMPFQPSSTLRSNCPSPFRFGCP